MYPGVMVFEPRVHEYLEKQAAISPVFSITRDIFPLMLNAGERLFGYLHEGYWRVLDTPADLAAGRAEIPLLARRPSSG